MKFLLCALLVLPAMSFAVDKCQKEISPTEKLYFQMEKTFLYPTDDQGRVNISIYKDLISNNKFAVPEKDTEEFVFAKSKIENHTVFGGLIYVSSSSSGETNKVVIDHKKEDVEAQKAQLLSLIASSVQHSNSTDGNVLYLLNKDGDSFAIDFRLPIGANPVASATKTESRFLSAASQSYLNSNGTITDALSKNKYELIECNEAVATVERTQVKDLGIFKMYSVTHEDYAQAPASAISK